MPEITIHLSEDAHTVLLAQAGSRGLTVGELVVESLRKTGLLSPHKGASRPRHGGGDSTSPTETALGNRRLLARLNEAYADRPSADEREFQKRMWDLQREQLAREPW